MPWRTAASVSHCLVWGAALDVLGAAGLEAGAAAMAWLARQIKPIALQNFRRVKRVIVKIEIIFQAWMIKPGVLHESLKAFLDLVDGFNTEGCIGAWRETLHSLRTDCPFLSCTDFYFSWLRCG